MMLTQPNFAISERKAMTQERTAVKGYERKLLLGMFAIMLAFLPVMGDAIYSLSKISAAQSDLVLNYITKLSLARDLRTEKIQQAALTPVFEMTGNQALLTRLAQSNQAFEATLTKLNSMVTTGQAKAMLAQINAQQQKMRSLAQPGIEMTGEQAISANPYLGTIAGPLTTQILQAIDNYVQYTARQYEDEKIHNAKIVENIIRNLTFASLLAIFFCVGVGHMLWKLVRQKRAYDEINERLAQREREISNARKEAVEMVAHDLKNPLSGIMMSIQMMQQGECPDNKERSQKMLDVISTCAESMKRLIDDLLDHAKIESGTIVLSRQPQDLSTLLNRLLLRFEPLATAKSISLKIQLSALPTLLVDEGRMDQVFSNLLGNAIKFTPPGGIIQISSTIRADGVTVSVADTGPGMAKEHAEHIFERYWQARETAGQGTGLGLAISKAIVLAHGGQIWVESEPGKGSVFKVWVPI